MNITQVTFFNVSYDGDEVQEEKLNEFLRSNRIVKIDRLLKNGLWRFSITYYQESSAKREKVGASVGGKGALVDYKERLSEEDFSLYLRLHKVRNDIARSAAIEKGVVLRNDELAEVAVRRCHTLTEFRQIPGVGENKTRKYGDAFLEVVREFEKDIASDDVDSDSVPFDVESDADVDLESGE